ncbi:MAG: class I SAM-dependent methyltransferase [Betaproteobacteria bacterium]|nr:class I SAM-dependent methyltransferase [Betaproteobacteria bacterium]
MPTGLIAILSIFPFATAVFTFLTFLTFVAPFFLLLTQDVKHLARIHPTVRRVEQAHHLIVYTGYGDQLLVRVEVNQLDVDDIVTRRICTAVVDVMLEMAEFRQGDRLIDLGCGDGRIVRTAARRYRVQGLGVDLDPALVGQAQALAREEGVGALCRFEVRDLYDTDLSQADVLTLYLLPAVNLALRPRLQALKPGTRILSHDWDLGDWSAQEIRWIDAPDKAVGFEKRSKILKWIIP